VFPATIVDNRGVTNPNNLLDGSNATYAVAISTRPTSMSDCPPNSTFESASYDFPAGSTKKFCRISSGGTNYDFSSWIMLKNNSDGENTGTFRLQA